MKCCINGGNVIRLLSLSAKLLKFEIQKCGQILCAHKPYFLMPSHIHLILPCFEGNIRYIALKPGQYLDIAREGGFWPAFDQSINLPFDLQGNVKKTSFLI